MRIDVRKAIALCGFMGLMTTGAWAADAAAGKTVYTAKCKTCHAADGAGNPAMAKVFKTEIKPLSSPDVQGQSDADLKKVITEGKGKMKPVGVTGADLDNVVAYVRTFKK
jgi:mono/diheme cytochrome c family protein